MDNSKLKIMYIFPHPDDESFGPAAIIYSQVKQGHNVYLLTLTKGGATKERFKLNLSVEQMGEIRYKEMLCVKDFLNLTDMEVLDLPDSGLKEMDPREIERIVSDKIKKIKPDIIVSYPVHGVSGFHDHLVMHAVIKRVYLELKENGADYLKRLAFLTLPDKGGPVFLPDGVFRMKQSNNEEIDCIRNLSAAEIEAMKGALHCYKTYQSVIDESSVVEKIGDKLYFEFFGENFNPPLNDITDFT
ncbi:MAG: PIG-L family deacetylase [Ignavibacteriaceae bacterium]